MIKIKLSLEDLKNKSIWIEKSYELPLYDIQKIRDNTEAEPIWLHFGAGNIFRALHAAMQQELINKGLSDKGIIVCEGFDTEIIDKAYKPFDDLSLLITLNADGSDSKKVLASVASSLRVDKDIEKLKKIAVAKSLQMITLTITEKGYSNIDSPSNAMSAVATLMLERYKAGAYPIALVSTDNCSHNGIVFKKAICDIASQWVAKGLADDGFVAYMSDENKVSFPCTMIDKITPRPSEIIKERLEADGYESTDIIITGKNTYTASFINAESAQYLIIEDKFPNGRPKLEEAGMIFTDRETVDKVERMKVCTCLNPLHTTLAVYGCLLGYTSISAEMKDARLKGFIEKVGYEEGLPVVTNPGIIKPEDFIKEVIEERLPNPFIPDTPQRIASDTSQKIPVRFGETVKAYAESPSLDPSTLKYIPLVFAGWLRYLLAVDDNGQKMELSPDPLIPELTEKLSSITLGSAGNYEEVLKPILSDAKLFGANLYQVGLAQKVLDYFAELTEGNGAVAKTLEKYIV